MSKRLIGVMRKIDQIRLNELETTSSTPWEKTWMTSDLLWFSNLTDLKSHRMTILSRILMSEFQKINFPISSRSWESKTMWFRPFPSIHRNQWLSSRHLQTKCRKWIVCFNFRNELHLSRKSSLWWPTQTQWPDWRNLKKDPKYFHRF